jgi:hypothetical protein
MRFGSPSRHENIESTCEDVRPSPAFRSQCSSHSQRFPPRCTVWACFIPKPRTRFAFQGFSPQPSLRSSSLLRTLYALAVSAYNSASRVAPAFKAAPSGCCSKSRSVTSNDGVSTVAVRSPPKLSALPGLPPSLDCDSCATSTPVLPHCDLTVTAVLDSSVSPLGGTSLCPQRNDPA